MRNKYFYSHIIATADISLSLADVDMPNEDRVKLIALAEENLHHAVLDAMLSLLSGEDKNTFLLHVSSDQHDKTWILLRKKVGNAEEKILKIAQEIKEEMHEDIKKTTKE